MAQRLVYGGDVAGPVFSSVMGSALRLMSVPPDGEPVINAGAPEANEPHRAEAGARKATT